MVAYCQLTSEEKCMREGFCVGVQQVRTQSRYNRKTSALCLANYVGDIQSNKLNKQLSQPARTSGIDSKIDGNELVGTVERRKTGTVS
jgi:hypothetical protein